MPVNALITFRQGTSAQWASANPLLSDGEPGWDSTLSQYKIGDGVRTWSNLQFKTLRPRAGQVTFADTTMPAAPAADRLTLFGQSIAGRMFLRQIGPSGLDTALQPFLARNKIGYWNPPGNAATSPGVFGFTAYTITSNVARNVATTNLFTRMRRLGFVTGTTTAGTLSHARVAVAQISIDGGFFKLIRFGISDNLAVATARMFMGISVSTAAATNVEPSTLTNVIGIGHGNGDTTMRIYYGGSTAQTPINLGANFPANTRDTDAYELALFAAPGATNTVTYEVTRLNTGHTAVGTLTGTAGVALPDAATLMSYSWNWRTNNATALAVGFDIMSDYIETDT